MSENFDWASPAGMSQIDQMAAAFKAMSMAFGEYRKFLIDAGFTVEGAEELVLAAQVSLWPKQS